MSIHKLTAGSGYDYLTRQVAALDATHKGHVGLAAYYTAKGEMPDARLLDFAGKLFDHTAGVADFIR